MSDREYPAAREVWRSPSGEAVLLLGDCLERMGEMEPATFDSIVCDPPYGLEFMGKEWDKLGAVVGEQDADTPGWINGSGEFVAGAKGLFGGSGKRVRYGASAASMQDWHYAWAVEALRVAKPGAHLLAFGGTRTFHRLTCALEDAGWEIRDCIMWVYGSGFPKSLSVDKAIDAEERRRWLNIGKAIDSADKIAILETWKEHSETAKFADVRFLKNETEIGMSTPRSGFVPESVLLSVTHKRSPASAIIAELNSIAARPTEEDNLLSAQLSAGENTTELSALVTIAGNLPASLGVTHSTQSSIAPSSVWGWPSENTGAILKAAEALMTWLGRKKSSDAEATSVLSVALTDALKLTTLSVSRSFQNLDTTQKMAFASATTATITESTAASLISFMVDTAKRIADDKAAGAEREVVGDKLDRPGYHLHEGNGDGVFGGGDGLHAPGTDARLKAAQVTAPATDAAREWQGWGTALKPAWEPIIVARKPLQGTVAANVQQFGTGAINIDGCRVGQFTPEPHSGGMERLNAKLHEQGYRPNAYQKDNGRGGEASADKRYTEEGSTNFAVTPGPRGGSPSGRWPANVVWSHVSLPVMRLADTIPLEIVAFIRGYFHGNSNLQALRQKEGNHTIQAAVGATVLQSEMQGSCSKDNASNGQDGSSLPGMWEEVPDVQVLAEKRTQEVLQPKVQRPGAKETDGREVAEIREEAHEGITRGHISQSNREDRIGGRAPTLEGREDNPQRICGGPHSDASQGSNEDGSPNEAEPGLYPGAQAGGSDEDRAPLNEVRHRASPGREPLAQPRGEFTRHIQQEAQSPASATGKGSISAHGGELPLEVLACDIPSEWLGYFEFTGEDLGCRLVGTERVKNPGGVPNKTSEKNSSPAFTSEHETSTVHHFDADGMETVEKWDCHPDCPSRGFPDSNGGAFPKSVCRGRDHGVLNKFTNEEKESRTEMGDAGSASRFFYCSKASSEDRNGSKHPTVKPMDLMRYLCRLVTRPGGLILDPFLGSGTTARAAYRENFRVVGIEREQAYFDDAVHNMKTECGKFALFEKSEAPE